jgi:hypothetical protein
MLATVNRDSPASSTGRRPKRSDTGPYSNWPIARPIRYSVMVSWDVPIDIPNARAVAGKAGIMMCIPSVPQAVMATSNRNGARARLPNGEEVKSRIIFPDVRRHHARTTNARQPRG